MNRFATSFIGAAIAGLAALAIAFPATGAAAGATASSTCASSNLVVWLPNGNGNGAAGSVYYKLRITNLGGGSCTLSGFPKVTAINSKGAAVGKPASNEPGSKSSVVTIKPGGSASFQLRVVEAGNFSAAACHATKAFGLRVTPPGAGGSKVVPFPFETCAKPTQSVLSVGPVKKG
jgi:uncharacterized protein DUF4232